MQSVYIETTIPSYLTSRKSRQASLAADQEATRVWWSEQRRRFRIFTSVFTLAEAGRGDPSLAGKRLAALEGIPTLAIPKDFGTLEGELIQLFQLPEKAATDASHLGLAIVHEIDYLLTWNCTHLANAVLQKELHRLLWLQRPACAGDLHSRNPYQAATMNNPIIEEVRAARASIAAEHGYDRAKILAWARAQQAALEAKIATESLRTPKPSKVRSGRQDKSTNGKSKPTIGHL